MTVDFGSPLGPVRPRRSGRLGDTVVTYLVDRIVSGEYPVDSALPTEPELCEEFGVSRTVIRESIKLLEEKGLVRATPGRGTRVLEAPGWNLLDPIVLEAQIRHDRELGILDDLVNVRAALESDMVAQTARVITAVQQQTLAEQLDVLASLLDDAEGYAAEDVVFHDLIMVASGNRLGHAIIHSIHSKARLSSRYNGTPTAADLEQSMAEHRRIEALIRAGDADGVGALMRTHIVGSWNRRRPEVHGALGRSTP
ncbi:FadR/GntR family transcriptional regulator [Cryptosporangium aurantiacum]|uniref:Transcriptional regulator, GntR family n=1 Tax=Cryptosporangium aurantiacum TaxID=134849 RepID=A0A1M7P7I8_9ACTN|nr:FadR/GntR family transcriptional regulator [Cryptosporangium aurantiacum]SHN12611.1 transcriptional regulator, GntR family [Cryptosporangium aurantiacum]